MRKKMNRLQLANEGRLATEWMMREFRKHIRLTPEQEQALEEAMKLARRDGPKKRRGQSR